MAQAPASPHSSENDNLKPGRPPQPSTQHKKDEAVSRNPHTDTDPQTGEPNKRR